MILDWMLPGPDGLAVCRRLRARAIVPILMLTLRADALQLPLTHEPANAGALCAS